MKRFNSKYAFVFMFAGMISFASEQQLIEQLRIEASNIKSNTQYVNSIGKEPEIVDGIGMVNVMLKEILSYQFISVELSDGSTEKRPTKNKALANSIHIAAGFVRPNPTVKNGLATFIDDAMKMASMVSFQCIDSIKNVDSVLEIAVNTGTTIKNIDRIIIYNAENEYSKSLRERLFFNAKNYENINVISSILDYTFVNENFDCPKFIDLINSVELGKICSFSVIISEDKNNPCVAFFAKNNAGIMRCMLINANENAKNLVKKLIPFFTNFKQGRLAVARFIAALYSPHIAIQKLEDLKLTESALYSTLNKQIEDSKKVEDVTQKHLKLIDENTELKNKNQKLDGDIVQLKADIELKTQRISNQDQLMATSNSEIIKLKTELKNNRPSLVELLLNKFTTGFVCTLIFFWWLFIKR